MDAPISAKLVAITLVSLLALPCSRAEADHYRFQDATSAYRQAASRFAHAASRDARFTHEEMEALLGFGQSCTEFHIMTMRGASMIALRLRWRGNSSRMIRAQNVLLNQRQ